MPLYQQGGLPKRGFDAGGGGMNALQSMMSVLRAKDLAKRQAVEAEQLRMDQEMLPFQKEMMQAQTEKYRQPQEITPTVLKGREMVRLLSKKEMGTITPEETAALEKMMVGQPLVQLEMGKPAAPSERESIATGRASLDTLNNLKTLFDSTQTKTGPISGRIAPTAGLFGMTSQDQENFMAATSAFKNQIIKEITGAQMSEIEAKRIMKQVPDIIDPPDRWRAKWEQSKLNLEMLQKRRLEILEQSGLRVPGEQTSGQPVKISTDEEWEKLKTGTQFIGPDGITRVK